MMTNKLSVINLIDKEFVKRECIEKIIVEERLYSKKNKLHKIKFIFNEERESGPAYFALKLYREEGWEKRKEKEYSMLKALKEYAPRNNIYVPDVVYKGKDFLITKFVEGDTLLDYILAKEANNEEIGFNELNPLTASCEIIKNFHNISKEITGCSYVFNDVNLRNFIISSRLYRVDFEDWAEGCLEGDFGKFIAFTLTYNPAFSSWKIKLAGELSKYICNFFHIDRSKLRIEIEKEFRSMERRRNLQPGVFEKYNI